MRKSDKLATRLSDLCYDIEMAVFKYVTGNGTITEKIFFVGKDYYNVFLDKNNIGGNIVCVNCNNGEAEPFGKLPVEKQLCILDGIEDFLKL